MSTRREFHQTLIVLSASALLGQTGIKAFANSSPYRDAIPPDLPLPSASISPVPWIHQASILQPWGETQFAALTHLDGRPERLRKEFGFNALIVLPTGAHNAITSPRYHLTDRQFRAGVDAYRKAGYRLILYSGVTNCGYNPQWQKGKVARQHPDWSQRDPKGHVVNGGYAHGWLCPNTPARAFALEYTKSLLRQYDPDGIMLDNNEYFYTHDGWACYCPYCQKAFPRYLRRRLTPDWIRRNLGADPDRLTLPTRHGPLWALWVHWRKRVWAETDEEFRTELRKMKPEIMLFGNTQYDFQNGSLAADLQFTHEDVVLSESRGLTSWYMSEKIMMGQAFSHGRPLWNYIGTFEESNYHHLRSPSVVEALVGASSAHGARPWIVYYGFEPLPRNRKSREAMSRVLSWIKAYDGLFGGARWQPVGFVISPRSRDLFKRPLIPEHVGKMVRAGVPLGALIDTDVSKERLNTFRVLTVENALVMDENCARELLNWVRAGGTLVALRDAGAYDVLGRKRRRSVLWKFAGITGSPGKMNRVGRGRILVADKSDFASVAIHQAGDFAFRFEPNAPIEIVVYREPGRILLHVVRHEHVANSLRMSLPAALAASGRTAEWYTPDSSQPRQLECRRDDGAVSVVMPEVPPYSILSLNTTA